MYLSAVTELGISATLYLLRLPYIFSLVCIGDHRSSTTLLSTVLLTVQTTGGYAIYIPFKQSPLDVFRTNGLKKKKTPLKCRVSMTDFQHPPFQGQNIPDICAKLVTFRDGRREGNVATDG